MQRTNQIVKVVEDISLCARKTISAKIHRKTNQGDKVNASALQKTKFSRIDNIIKQHKRMKQPIIEAVDDDIKSL